MKIIYRLMIIAGVVLALLGFLEYFISSDMREMKSEIAKSILFYKNGNDIDPNDILGQWKGSYERKGIGLTFSNDSVQFDYQGVRRQLRYIIEGDTILMQSDTGRITALNQDIFSIRPLNEIEEDVNVIFTLDFIRVQ